VKNLSAATGISVMVRDIAKGKITVTKVNRNNLEKLIAAYQPRLGGSSAGHFYRLVKALKIIIQASG
jgi:hypothetical protein